MLHCIRFLVLAILFATAATAHQRTFHFEITQQPLSQALRNYGQICGRDVIFTEDIVAGAGAADLEGDYTAEEALSRLLAGTNLGVCLVAHRHQARGRLICSPAPISGSA